MNGSLEPDLRAIDGRNNENEADRSCFMQYLMVFREISGNHFIDKMIVVDIRETGFSTASLGAMLGAQDRKHARKIIELKKRKT